MTEIKDYLESIRISIRKLRDDFIEDHEHCEHGIAMISISNVRFQLEMIEEALVEIEKLLAKDNLKVNVQR